MKFYTDIDLKQNELQNAVIHALASAPSGKMGQLYYNTNEKAMYQHNGTEWVRVGVLYDMALGDKAGNSIPITLAGSDGSLDVVNITGDGDVTLSKSGNEIIISTSDTNTTYSFASSVSPTKYTITVTPSTGDATVIEIPVVDSENAGLMTPAQAEKLAGVEDGAQVNTNNFSEIVVDNTPISATSDEDTFTLEAGSNITITPDTANKKATISADNTSYPEGTPAQIEGGDSITPSIWSPKTLHDYVDQKTSEIDIGYTCEADTLFSEEVVTEEDSGSGDIIGNLQYSEPITADALTVTFDGITYYCEAQKYEEYNYYGAFVDEEGGESIDFSEYPFVLVSDFYSQVNVVITETAGAHTIEASTGSQVVTSDCFEAAVKSVAGGGGGGEKTTFFGYSSTANITAVKAVSCADFPYTGDGDIPEGTMIGVMFDNGNTTSSPELSINDGYPVSITVGSASTNSGTNTLKWSSSAILYFMYASNTWHLISVVTQGAETPRGANTWYGTCSTNISTPTKSVTAPNYVLTRGSTVVVTFTSGNNADVPTLNVNSTGAKPIYIHGSAVSATNPLKFGSNSVLTFMYDGTRYHYVGADQFMQTATVTLAPEGWSDNLQTATVNGVTTSNTIIVTPDPISITDYASAGIYCSGQSANTLEFTCTTVPTNYVVVNILMIYVKYTGGGVQ